MDGCRDSFPQQGYFSNINVRAEQMLYLNEFCDGPVPEGQSRVPPASLPVTGIHLHK